MDNEITNAQTELNEDALPVAIICVGPGCSGKSTYAKGLVYSGLYEEVNRDALRFPDGIIDWSKWEMTPENEERITQEWNRQLDAIIETRRNVVISDTNLHLERRAELERKLTLAGYDVETRYFVENMLTLLVRNAERDLDALPEEVIVTQQTRMLRELLDEAQETMQAIRD